MSFNADVVPLVLILTTAYPLPLFLYYFYEEKVRGRAANPYVFFVPPLLMVLAAIVCLLIDGIVAPSRPPSVLNPLWLVPAADTILRGLTVPFTSIWSFMTIASPIIPLNPNLWGFGFTGYVFVLLVLIFPVVPWCIADLAITRTVLPLKEIETERGTYYPKGAIGYRDIPTPRALPDPEEWSGGEGAAAAADTGAGTGEGEGGEIVPWQASAGMAGGEGKAKREGGRLAPLPFCALMRSIC